MTSFLDTKIKDVQEDPEKKWITTWNYYLLRLRIFFRWLYNVKIKGRDDEVSAAADIGYNCNIAGKRPHLSE